MKKVIIFCFLLLVCFSYAFGQKARSHHKFILKHNPVGLLFSTAVFGVEVPMGRKISFEADISGTYRNVDFWDEITGQLSGYGFSGQLKYYLYDSPLGVHFDLVGQYSDYQAIAKWGEDRVPLIDGHTILTGASLGWQTWVYLGGRKAFMVDVFLGANYQWSTFDGRFAPKTRTILFKTEGILPRFGLSLGIPI